MLKVCYRNSTETRTRWNIADSDWADRRSISGYAFKLCDESPLISWESKKQSIVALSSSDMTKLNI